MSRMSALDGNVFGIMQKGFDVLRGSICLTLAAMAFSLASCCPVFENPLPVSPEPKADSQLLGTWFRTSKAGEEPSGEQVSIFRRSSGWIDVVHLSWADGEEAEGGVGVLVFDGYCTTINGRKFLCLRFRKDHFTLAQQAETGQDANDAKSQLLLRYWFIMDYVIRGDNELVVRPFSREKIQGLIEQSKLKGQAGRTAVASRPASEGEPAQPPKQAGSPFGDVVVTSSSDELVQAIFKEGVDAFVDEGDDMVFSKGAYQPPKSSASRDGD